MNQLEIGTEIYQRSYGNDSFFGKVDRVTNNFAFCRTTKFKRECTDEWVD